MRVPTANDANNDMKLRADLVAGGATRSAQTPKQTVEWQVMSEPFANEPIAVSELPVLRDETFVSVDARYVWGQLVGLAGAVLVVVAVTALIVWGSGALFWPILIGGAVVAVLCAVAVAALVEARRMAYQVREHDLSLRSGVIRRRVETIPFSRVQHVSVGRGVVERSLGLATLELSSAGPDIAVPGLSVDDADRIKQTVAVRAGVDDEPTETASPTSWASPPPPASRLLPPPTPPSSAGP